MPGRPSSAPTSQKRGEPRSRSARLSTPPPPGDPGTLRCSSMVLFWAKSRGQDGHLKTLTRWGSKCWSKCEERRGLCVKTVSHMAHL